MFNIIGNLLPRLYVISEAIIPAFFNAGILSTNGNLEILSTSSLIFSISDLVSVGVVLVCLVVVELGLTNVIFLFTGNTCPLEFENL